MSILSPLYFESDLVKQAVSITVGQLLREGDSWAGMCRAGLEERRRAEETADL